MQFGISTHLYHGARLDRDHLVEIAAHGFEAVEIFATRTHFDYHDERVVAAIGEHLADARLRPHSVHATDERGLHRWCLGARVLDRAWRRSQQAPRG
jgi:esterase/lipase superfamily enzyme